MEKPFLLKNAEENGLDVYPQKYPYRFSSSAPVVAAEWADESGNLYVDENGANWTDA